MKVLVAQPRLTLGNPMNLACQAPLCMGFSRQEYSPWTEDLGGLQSMGS